MPLVVRNPVSARCAPTFSKTLRRNEHKSNVEVVVNVHGRDTPSKPSGSVFVPPTQEYPLNAASVQNNALPTRSRATPRREIWARSLSCSRYWGASGSSGSAATASPTTSTPASRSKRFRTHVTLLTRPSPKLPRSRRWHSPRMRTEPANLHDEEARVNRTSRVHGVPSATPLRACGNSYS